MPAVTIDLWHTLMYLRPEDEEVYMAGQLAAGREVLTSAPLRPGAPELSSEALGRAFEGAYSRAVAASVDGRSVTPAQQLAEAASETGRTADPRDYLDKLKVEIQGTNFRRAPGALYLLRTLRDRGYRLGMISNTVGEPGAFLRPVLTSLGFDPYVETYVFSDEHPWAKPSPDIFRYALKQLGESPHEAVHVGDGWADIEGAHRAELRGAILFTGLHSYATRYRQLFLSGAPKIPRASYRTERLANVPSLVRRLLPLG